MPKLEIAFFRREGRKGKRGGGVYISCNAVPYTKATSATAFWCKMLNEFAKTYICCAIFEIYYMYEPSITPRMAHRIKKQHDPQASICSDNNPLFLF